MTLEERVAFIDKALSAFPGAWPLLVIEIDQLIADLTEQLVNNDNEQTRGRIKALRGVKELPISLLTERDGIRAALSEQDAAD